MVTQFVVDIPNDKQSFFEEMFTNFHFHYQINKIPNVIEFTDEMKNMLDERYAQRDTTTFIPAEQSMNKIKAKYGF